MKKVTMIPPVTYLYIQKSLFFETWTGMFSNGRSKALLRSDSFTFHKRKNYFTVTYEGHALEHDPGIVIMRMHKKRSIF